MGALDMPIEEAIHVAVQEAAHQGGALRLVRPSLEQASERVAHGSGRVTADRCGAEAELACELPQRGVGENEDGGGDLRIQDGVAEHVAELGALDRQRWHERDRAPTDEHRAHRAARHRGQQVEPALGEVELDGIALQREVVDRGDAVASWREPAQRLEHGLVGFGRGAAQGSGGRRRPSVQPLGARRRHEAAEAQCRGDGETGGEGGHAGLRPSLQQEMWRRRPPRASAVVWRHGHRQRFNRPGSAPRGRAAGTRSAGRRSFAARRRRR